jgi:hypothetical protein
VLAAGRKEQVFHQKGLKGDDKKKKQNCAFRKKKEQKCHSFFPRCRALCAEVRSVCVRPANFVPEE